jgi:hypothetical protein
MNNHRTTIRTTDAPPAPVPFRSTNQALHDFFVKRGIVNNHPWRKAKHEKA